MSIMKQVCAVSLMSLKSVPERLGPSTVAVVGVAGMVAVMICVFALAQGFERAAIGVGRSDRAIVLSEGSTSEAASRLGREVAARIGSIPGIRKDSLGKAITSTENLAFLAFPDRRTQRDSIVTLRGVSAGGTALRPEIRVVQGRMFQPGMREVIVGQSAQTRVQGLSVGDIFSPGDWTVVGVFESGGDLRESDVLTDSDTLASALKSNSMNSVTVLLENADSFAAFNAALASDPTLRVVARRESEYYLETAGGMNRILRTIGYTIAGIMALGAIVAAVNSMYAAVSSRMAEIATLRAIGFNSGSVAMSVLIEIVVLALVGSALGGFIAWAFFNGNNVSTLSGVSPSQITFSLQIDAQLLVMGATAALLVGLLGGLLPALRAARLSVAEALRSA